MELKRCTKCGENKPNTNEYFAYLNKSKGKLRPSCKVCDKEYRENNRDKVLEYQKEYRENNRDKIREYIKEYRENNRDKIREKKKEYRENNKDKEREHNKRYYENNKDKIREIHKRYYENNKDKIREYRENNKDKEREYSKRYYENNRDKILEKHKIYKHKKRGNGGAYTKAQWLDTLEYFDYKCAYTGECIKHSCHVEHIVPISKGGTSYIWNLVPSTESANCSKGNRGMEEWYREQEYFCEERLNKIYEYQKNMAAKYK